MTDKILSYLNFDLLIEKTKKGYRVRVIASPAGETTKYKYFTLPFREDELRTFTWLPNYIYHHLRLSKPNEVTRSFDQKSFGRRLFKAVFAEGIDQCLLRCLDATKSGAGLRIRLRISADAPELGELPWEYLYIPDLERFPACSKKTPIVRYIELEQPVPLVTVELPLRILLVTAQPSGVELLNTNQELVRVETALANLQQRGLITFDRLEGATVSALRQRLRQSQIHILHFIGHGFFNVDTNTGGLILENEADQPHFVSAEILGMLLHDHESLRLVFLNACEGAHSGSEHTFAGTAQHLVQQGIPAVIAMQFPVGDTAAIALAQEFYQAISDGAAVDAALSDARIVVRAQGNAVEWGTPVLFMRAKDGQLFQIKYSKERLTDSNPAERDSSEREKNHGTRVLPVSKTNTNINTGGGTFIGGNVNPGGDFVGRDKIIITGDVHWGPQIEILPPPELKRPPAITGFVGREVELAYYADKLRSSNLVLISGIAGVGKTALAVKLAEQNVKLNKLFWHRFEEGDNIKVVILRLAGFLAHQGHDELWRSLERERQTPGNPRPIETILDYLLQWLRGRDYLLCLDDLQVVDEDREHQQLVEQLLPLAFSGELKLIITSQRVPDFLSKWKLNFSELEGLSTDDILQLIITQSINLPADLVARLNKYTGGNVQIILMALDILRNEEDPSDLISHLAEVDNIQIYLMQQIFRRLNEHERRVMGAVAILLGDSGTSKMIDVILEGQDVGYVHNVLGNLSRRHLLIYTKERISARRKYSQHAMIQAFYYEHTDKGLQRKMHRKAAEFYEIEEVDLWKAVLHYNQAREFLKVVELATTYTWKLMNNGHTQTLLKILEQLRPDPFTVEQWATVGITKGELYLQMAEIKSARKVLEATFQQLNLLQLSPKVTELKIRTLSTLAWVVQEENPQQALDLCQRGLDLAIANNLTEQISELKLQIGEIQIHTDDYDKAIENIESVIEQLPEYIKIDGLIALSGVHIKLGNMERSIEYSRQALGLAQSINDDFSIVSIQSNLALCLYYRGDWQEATVQIQKALDSATKLGGVYQRTRLMLNFGVIHLNAGDDLQAKEKLVECIKMTNQYELTSEIKINALSSLADLYLRRGELTSVHSLLAEAEAIAQMIQDRDLLVEIYRNWSRLHLINGDLKPALAFIEQSVEMARAIGAKLEEGMSLCILADIKVELGYAYSEVLPLYEESLAYLEGDWYESARTKMKFGRVLLKNIDPLRGKTLLQEAQATFQKLDAKRDLQEIAHSHLAL